MISQTYLRTVLERYEGVLNRLHGLMSPQLEMEMEWCREVALKNLLEQQLLEFDRN